MTSTSNTTLWLGTRLIREQWPAFIYSALYFIFMGCVLAMDEQSYTREFAHPLMMLIIMQPALNARYLSWKQDNDVVQQQMFLRSLPLPFTTIVGARAVVMLASGAINVVLYFLAFWFLGPSFSSIGAWLAWSVFWTGVAVALGGVSLTQEFWLSNRRWMLMNVIIVFAIGVAALLGAWLGDIRLFDDIVRQAAAHPWLYAGLGIAIGGVGGYVGYALAVRQHREREFLL